MPGRSLGPLLDQAAASSNDQAFEVLSRLSTPSAADEEPVNVTIEPDWSELPTDIVRLVLEMAGLSQSELMNGMFV